MVATHKLQISTRGQGDAHDITRQVSATVRASGPQAGVAVVFVVGSTAAVTTIEFEPGAVADLNGLFERLAPRRAEYQHHLRWGDDNGSSHVRAAILGPSLSVPFIASTLVAGTWQQIVLVELDTRGRQREVVVQLVGDRS
jgi:secondary thiamine-phosphate synthase enzyme